MRNTGKRIVMGIFFLLFLASAAYARENFTISVSCSIPAVPGLNAPIANNNVRVDGNAIKQQNTQVTAQSTSANQETNYVKQQDSKVTGKDNKDAGSTNVTSVYTR